MLIFREIPCTELDAKEPHAAPLLAMWPESDPITFSPDQSALVVYEDEMLIGISVISSALTDTKPRCAVMSRLIMLPAVRRHGLGRMLMGQTAGAALARGAYFLAAHVPDTAEASAFADSVGLRETPLFSDMRMLDLSDVDGLRPKKAHPHA